MNDNENSIDPRVGIYQPQPVNNSMSNATGNDSSGYLRADWRDGKLVHAERGKVAVGSVVAATNEQNVAMGMPFEFALDPHHRTRISPYELQEDSIASFGGAEMTIAQARAAGFIPPGWVRPGANAGQVQPAQSPTQGQPQTTQDPPKQDENPDLKVDLLPDLVADRDYSALIDSTGGAEQLTAISEIVETGEMTPRTMGALCTQLQCEPEQLQARMSPIMASFEKQARTVMAEGGLDSNDVVAWAQQNKPDLLQRAMHRQATLRNTSGYAHVRQAYLESLADHNPSAALNADLGPGITQRQDTKGRVIVRFPDGSEVEWEHAIRAFGPGSKR